MLCSTLLLLHSAPLCSAALCSVSTASRDELCTMCWFVYSQAPNLLRIGSISRARLEMCALFWAMGSNLGCPDSKWKPPWMSLLRRT